MPGALSAPELALLLIGVSTGLGVALVWAIWDIDQPRQPAKRPKRRGTVN